MRNYVLATTLLVWGCGSPAGGDPASSPTPNPINGTCVAPGQLFTQVYSCATVQGPSPTSSDGASSQVSNPDPDRLDDPDRAWMSEQLAACSCICCHSTGAIAAYVWAHDFSPVFTDSMSDETLVDAIRPPPTGAPSIPPELNHGFSRENVGFPTTDAARFEAYFDREIARRGL